MSEEKKFYIFLLVWGTLAAILADLLESWVFKLIFIGLPIVYAIVFLGIGFYGLACGGGFPETPDQWIEKVLMFEEDVFKDIYGTDEYRIAYDEWREQLEANY